jgi:SAM-dependent methyltransferase
MTDHDARRRAVADDYARALADTGPEFPEAGGGCCGGGPRNVVTRLAGYTAADTTALPADAVTNAFGCGNPVAFAGVQAGEVVLDLGSGAGLDLLVAARAVGPTGRVIGVDMTDAMIARARQNVAAAGLDNVDVRRGLIEDLPVNDASVDWVISNCVINLSPEKPRVFAEIARVLKPGGHLRVSDIVAHDLPQEIASSQRLYSSCLAGAIDEAAYLDSLRAAGLADVTVAHRHVYDEAQLAAFLGSEIDGQCCGGEPDARSRAWAPTLVGKVASVTVTGRRG